MDVLHTLKNTYVKERRTATARSHLTLRGFFLRLFNAEKYWDELTAHENQLLDLGARTLSDILNVQGKSTRELKTYQLILKNLNAKLTERGNFLLVLVTLITALGLTKVNDILDFSSMSRDGLILFAIAILTIFLALNDTLRVRNRAAIHEELSTSSSDICWIKQARHLHQHLHPYPYPYMRPPLVKRLKTSFGRSSIGHRLLPC
ncbi:MULTISPECIES: hypothetical protein [unclassified Pseudomonas]|uniref:hypothetical protein n=1 Tax=unclassified Pseudomonas TaxID=196821 RepID=UPI001B31F30F|nr:MULTISPECIES: hypothetical protein [unclassified Pseudomonas]